jgi:hypothetical protein
MAPQVRNPGDKLKVEGVVQPLCDERGRCGVRVEDTSKPNGTVTIEIGSDEAAGCHTVYDWLDKTLSHYYLWDTEVKVRITIEVLAVNRKPTR